MGGVTETGAPARASLGVRLGLTFGLPIGLLAVARWIALPGIDHGLLRGPQSADSLSLTPFALGLMPLLTAYVLVELVALVVPPLARLRHGNPAGRAKLERAALVLAYVLGAVQAFGIATSVKALSASPLLNPDFDVSTPIVVASLLGGMSVSLVVANFVTRQGIVNGIVLLPVLEAIVALRASLAAGVKKAEIIGALEPTTLALLALALTLPVLATWLALRGGIRETASSTTSASGAPRGSTDEAGDPLNAPYRHARSLALMPTVPVPASALAPFAIAPALLMLPALVQAAGPRARAFALSLDRNEALWPALQLALTLGLALIFARLLHRPREMADLLDRLGAGRKAQAEVEARGALRRALLPTLLLLTTLVLAANIRVEPFAISLLALPLLVAVVMDIATALSTLTSAPELVSIWHERRATAVPVLCAVLEAEGITTRTRGMHVLHLLQVFAPYAPAEILVCAEDASQATAILERVLLGGPAPERNATTANASLGATTANASLGSKPTTQPRRAPRLIALGITTALALAAFVGTSRGRSHEPSTSAGRARLEVVRVDDAIEPFAHVDEDAVPSGIELRFENLPSSLGQTRRVFFATTAIAEGESSDQAAARLELWLATLPLPRDQRFALGTREELDDETGARVIGLRSFVLTGAPILTTLDVTDATAAMDEESSSMPDAYVAVTLSLESADRFADATDEWTNRRIAILLDGRISSAPVVRGRIGGGRISINMGRGTREKQLEEARQLAQGLAGRR